MQTKTVILAGGAGVVGRQVAAILRRRQPDLRLVLAGRRLDAVQAAAAPLEAEAMRWDIDAPDLDGASRGAIIVGLANDLNDRLLTAALAAGSPYLDVTRWTSAQKQALTTVGAQGRPAAAPVVFASSWMASTIGLIARDAARELASVERIDIGVLFGLADRAGPNSVAYMDRISTPFLTLEDGVWRERRGFRDGQIRDFGEGGSHRLYRFDTPDQANLPALTGARTVEARIAFDGQIETRLVHVLVASGVWKALSGQRFEKLRRSMLYNPGDGAAHRVRIDLEGRDAQGETIRRTVQVVDPEGQTHLTALGAVIQIERLLGRLGPALEPGVHLGEAMPDPAPATALLKSEGVRISG
jgi:hypothetical protein